MYPVIIPLQPTPHLARKRKYLIIGLTDTSRPLAVRCSAKLNGLPMGLGSAVFPPVTTTGSAPTRLRYLDRQGHTTGKSRQVG